MIRSVVYTALLDLEPEFGKLETCPRDLGGAVITDAVASIPPKHPNLYDATRDYLDGLRVADPEPGYLARHAETLLQQW